MNKKFIAGGDSFTFGSELSDCTGTTHSKLTWSAQLAKKLNLDYLCVAKQGAGNSAIMRLTIKAIENTPDVDFVAVMWSWPTRTEFKVNQLNEKILRSVIPPDDIEDSWINITPWNSLSYDERMDMMPSLKSDPYWIAKYKKQVKVEKELELDVLSKIYFSLTSDQHHLYQSALAIFTLQSYLEKKNIKFVFAATTDHLLEIFNQTDIPFVNMIDKSKWLNVDKGMFQWAKDNNYPISAMNHPVEQAHRDWLNVYYKD